LIRLLAIYVVAVFLAAGGGIWLVFEYELLPFARSAPDQDLVTGSASTGTQPTRRALDPAHGADKPAIAAHDLEGRSFGPSPLPLSLPIDCEPGVDCWVINFVDLDPTKGRLDFACGQMSYNTHKGTDIAVAHEGRLAENIPVLAAASGKVIGRRDGMADVSIRVIGRDKVKGKECGNDVRIDHGAGWHTQYCHLRKGSIRVKAGDRVRAGDPIGAVGLSGMTEFPHIHLSVEKDGKVIDPFVGISGGKKCDLGNAPLWRRDVLKSLRYLSAVPYNLGFADRVPKAEEIRAGAFDGLALPATSSAVVFWAEVAGLQPRDVVTLRLFGPDGAELASKQDTITKHRIRIWRAVGKKSANGWSPGSYRGEVTIRRETDDGPVEARRGVNLDVY